MRKVTFLVLPLLAALGFTAPAHATDTSVHLDVDVDLFTVEEHADCDVTVPAESDGLDVLDEAVDQGCIDSYVPEDFGFGKYIACIDDICEQPSAYAIDQPSPFPVVSWLIYLEDGSFAEVGVSELAFPTDGDTLSFSYEPWPVHAACFILEMGCPGEDG